VGLCVTVGLWVKVAGPGVLAVVHAFCTIAVAVTGVMGREITSQLHFDGDPGIAVGVPPGPLNGYGKVGGLDTH
jgi:hypothetical protein